MKLIDVSLPLNSETVHWPGHPRYKATNLMSIAAGEGMNVSEVSMCSHFGTHIDAPSHYFPEGRTIDQLPLDLLVGPCLVVDYEGDQHISDSFVSGLDLEGVRRLLIRTRNSDQVPSPEFDEDYVAVTPVAAQALVDQGIELLGVDGHSIGPWDAEIRDQVHKIFLSGGACQVAIEGLNLREALPGLYKLMALPLPVAGLEAAPARVLLQHDDVE